ncbi:MAG: signal peptidase I [Chloroflexi bacterium]|nr:signal peptidase I [Chloroflexota bacterium]
MKQSSWWSHLAQRALRVPGFPFLLHLLSSTRFVVEGDSMAPGLVHQQYVLASRWAYRLGPPARGDIVVVRDPQRPWVPCLKRIVGLPGEEVLVEGDGCWVNGSPVFPAAGDAPLRAGADQLHWRLGPQEYVVLGDNRADSRDSRAFGPVHRRHIVGRVWLCYWPRERWGRVGVGAGWP